jgi:hypothetical protein
MFREGFTIEERELGKFSGAERETAILPVLEEEVKYSRQYRYPLYSLFPPKERTPETKPEALISSSKRKQSFSPVPVLPAPKMYPTKIFEKGIKKYIEPLESKQYAKLLLLTREPLPPPVYRINVRDKFIKPEIPVIEVAWLEYLINLINRNLDMLLENLDNNKFTIEDAEKFAEVKRIIKSREQVLSWLYEKYISVYTTYLEKLAAPSYSSSLAVLVLGILDEAKRPLSYREIKNEVEKILDRRLDKDSEFWLWLALEILVSPIKGVPLVKEKGIIFTKYELTNEGKIVAVIRKDDYGELKRNRGVYKSP